MALHRPSWPVVSVSTLSPDHYATFKQALSNILHTDLAELTMAQLVDGLPTISVYLEGYAARKQLGPHPIKSHERLCDGALERTKQFCDNFDPSTLEFKSSLMQSFQDYIDSVVSWQSPSTKIEFMPGEWLTMTPLPALPSMFTHTEYRFHENYPNGLADVAAYWAEDRIFGGVVLFDRGKTGTECKDVYLHSNRREWTVRVWRLLESQLDKVLVFLKDSNASTESPFPLYADENNRHRYDSFDAMAWYDVYRDPWERVLPAEKNWDSIRRNTFDYPELQEELFDKVLDGPCYTFERNSSLFGVIDRGRGNEQVTAEYNDKLATRDDKSGLGTLNHIDEAGAEELFIGDAQMSLSETKEPTIRRGIDTTESTAFPAQDAELLEQNLQVAQPPVQVGTDKSKGITKQDLEQNTTTSVCPGNESQARALEAEQGQTTDVTATKQESQEVDMDKCQYENPSRRNTEP
ncbi:hypothetical protein NOR_02334 [Metarhizium rileyi]|uniref:Uncharacterized protein n=1 Tax=Metarhizium rileyi (strain RCEF 4871) TaxID=1649241 RepID=A0A167HF82_METRR|nr:hypothetical protein NOR_02334 [Metarhizium rileyi RCEF 4871]